MSSSYYLCLIVSGGDNDARELEYYRTNLIPVQNDPSFGR